MHRERGSRDTFCASPLVLQGGLSVGFGCEFPRQLAARIDCLILARACTRSVPSFFCSFPQLKSLSKALKEISEAKEESAELDAKKAALQKRYVALAHGSTQMLLCLGLLGFYNKPRLTGFFGVCTSALVRSTTTAYSHAVTIGPGQCKDDTCDENL